LRRPTLDLRYPSPIYEEIRRDPLYRKDSGDPSPIGRESILGRGKVSRGFKRERGEF
jgi:hypothetical protein